jgi:hypothetical protein
MLGQLGNTLPLPGGVGGVEPIMLGILTASGVDAGLAGAAIILYRLISLGLQTVLGGLATASLVRSLGPRATGAVTSASGLAGAGNGIDPPRRPSQAEASIGIGTSAGT